MERKKIVLPFSGRITPVNVEDLEERCMEQIKDETDPELLLDMEKLEYISSAGLRLVMKLKARAGSLSVINVSPEIYELFSITGLTHIIDVKKVIRKIDTEGLEVLGEGVTAVVYRLNPEQIVKVYKEGVTQEEIFREQEVTRAAFLAGVPTMMEFETVRAGERLGTVYEAFNFETLESRYLSASEKERELLTKKHAGIVREMTSIRVERDPEALGQRRSGDFASDHNLNHIPEKPEGSGDKAAQQNEKEPGKRKYVFDSFLAGMYDRLDRENKRLGPGLSRIYTEMLDLVPDDSTFVHGDCHMGNIMLADQDTYYVIDLGISGYGNPVFSLSAVCLYRLFAELFPEVQYQAKTKVAPEEGIRLFQRFIRAWFSGASEEDLKKTEEMVYIYCCLFSSLNYAGTPLLPDDLFRLLSEKVRTAWEAGTDFPALFEAIKNSRLSDAC